MRAIVVLLVNGLAVVVKIAWTFTVKGFLTAGVSPEQQGTVLFERKAILWAASLTALFAVATVSLRRWRDWIELAGERATAERRRGRASSTEAAATDDSGATPRQSRAKGGRSLVERSAVPASAPSAALGCRSRVGRRLTQRLQLLEETMGWTAGCAWTDALIAYTPLGVNTLQPAARWPSRTLASACLFTLLGVSHGFSA